MNGERIFEAGCAVLTLAMVIFWIQVVVRGLMATFGWGCAV